MIASTRQNLRRTLAERYRQIRARLSRRLGSDSLADEALHETWLRLGKGGELAPVANEEAYLIRVAMNLASDLRIGEERHAHTVELEEIAGHADEAPDAHRAADAKLKVEKILEALQELPPRQADIFLACFMHGASTEDMAARYGVSPRTVQTDLRAAVFHCARRLGRKEVFADRGFKVSRE
ncbi:RNA polymerase sigma factor [Sandaracinobacter sp. RS1-74]|uniref:RNA polymerase sigma factor n=1 Tax=Sandaracinobacteroides sayramensis TaxID=2913411 RepID=UPI001EDA9858|nr:RNA polymerase sigma factor [Sandaracinobacteroides sayramensis]MCG2841374.1 RNA polymerase sigma factor [Sandaracinobacteroides sayramensis]